MITLPELLEDKTYRKFFEKPPRIPDVQRISPPYRIWVKRNGKWHMKNISSYRSGRDWFLSHLDDIEDGALAIKGTMSAPPKRLVKVKKNGVLLTKVGSDGVERPVVKEAPWVVHLPTDERKHLWCPYCRRPTVFTYFSKHHNQPIVLQPEFERCTICGVRSENLPKEWR